MILFRSERKKLEMELKEKCCELDKTQNDFSSIRTAIEYNLESERRYVSLTGIIMI